ncbi:FAD-dependent oxidoreductase [Streptomyces sp. NPDC020875]|uniref:FAD-dependent oxidoreductase n=1 Tax=Streptomyces sp. NPDC020875 TaxID=3154898 RepID=UPI00341016D1
MTASASHRTHGTTPARDRVTVVGGGLAGLTAAVAAAEAGAPVTLYEAHHTLGGRARISDGPYRVHEGPHVFYTGPMWSWLKRRGLIGPTGRVPFADATRLRFLQGGELRRTPPRGLLRLARIPAGGAPVDETYTEWATRTAGPAAAAATANFMGVALFHHDPGSLSAAFVHRRFRRVTGMPPGVRYPLGGFGQVLELMAARARDLGVRIETSARVDELPADRGPVIVATSLAAARGLLGDDSLRWSGGRTVLLDLAVRRDRRDPFVVSDLDRPGWVERFSAVSPLIAPRGESLYQAQFPVGPDEGKAEGLARAERVLGVALPGWRARETWRRTALAQDRSGAVDPPGTTWRDRPAVDRGDGVFLAGDQVAADGLLGEVAFGSGLTAAPLAVGALGAQRRDRGAGARAALDLKFG